MHYRLVSWILKSSGTYSCKSGLSGITWLLYVSGLEDGNVLPENKTCRLCHSVHRGQNKTSTTVREISRRAESGGDHPKHGRHGLFLTEQRGLYDVWLLGGPEGGTTGETAIMYLCSVRPILTCGSTFEIIMLYLYYEMLIYVILYYCIGGVLHKIFI